MRSSTITPLSSRILPLAALVLLPLLPLRAAYDLPELEKVEKQVQNVAEKATPCIVALTHPEKQGMASGSGCVIAQDGLILTAAHVVGTAKTVDVVFPDRKQVHAKVLGADYTRDVALAIITEPGDYPFMELGDTKKLAVGDMVVALGHPGGFDPQRKPPVRFGRVFQFPHDRFIRSDCTLIGGDSGGPLFDLEGKVVGVHSFVGLDMSENNDAPAEAVREDWDRLIKGEHWGKLHKDSLASKLSEGELHGLDVDKFHELILGEAMKSKGRLNSSPENLAKWLTQCGMAEDKVKAMSPLDLVAFMQKALGDGAQVMPGLGLDESALLSMTKEELAGLDSKKFRDRVTEEGLKGGGKLEADPETLKKWLVEFGMKEDRVKAMTAGEVAGLVGKVLGSQAVAKAVAGAGGGGAALPETELAGLDLEKFRKCVVDEALKNNGKLEATTERIADWLQDCGMKEERVKAMSPTDLAGFMQKALGSNGGVQIKADEKPASTTAAPTDTELAGLDLEKFKKRIVEEAMTHGGKVAATPEGIRKWLRECGMNDNAVKAFKPEKLTGLVQKALGGEAKVSGGGFAPTKEEKVIIDQDKEVMEAVKPGLEKIAPSMVSLGEGDKTLALGTIIREDGFIVTKHSAIAKAKALQAHLADGRTLPAVEVQQFPENDLSLVKIATSGLKPVTISDTDNGVHLGSFLFSPGVGADEPIVGQGVLSVLDRPLKQMGGFLGIGMNEVNETVEVTDVVPDSPAAKAGLEKKDQILAVGDTPVHKAMELSDHIRALKPDSTVQLKYRRGTEEKIAEVTLGDRAKSAAAKVRENPMGAALGTEVSDLRTGFPLIFQHDQPLKPEQCGGVILDLHGNVVGVNIARAGRIETYALPSKVVAGLLKDVDFHALGEKAAEALSEPPKA